MRLITIDPAMIQEGGASRASHTHSFTHSQLRGTLAGAGVGVGGRGLLGLSSLAFSLACNGS